MGSSFVFILVFVLAVLTGAVLAWPVHELLSVFFDPDYRRVITYTTLGTGVVVSILYLSWYCRPTRSSLGLDTGQHPYHREFLYWLLIGVLLLILVEATLLISGVHVPRSGFDFSPGNLLLLLCKGLVIGLVVSIIEELIFRGGLYGGLRLQTTALSTILIVSLVYAAVHYLKYPDIDPDIAITWSTGLESLPRALNRFARPVYYDAMFSLFLLGILFGVVRHISGNIVSCIGLHTGIVAADRLITRATDYVPDAGLALLANRYQTTLGHASSAWLILFSLFCLFFLRRRYRHESGS